jgi:lysophospholipase L1-like esterase
VDDTRAGLRGPGSRLPPFRFGTSTWRNTDVRAFADAMRGLDGTLIDLVATFGAPADPALQGADGIHPTLAGQSAIVRSLVDGLAPVAPVRSEAAR